MSEDRREPTNEELAAAEQPTEWPLFLDSSPATENTDNTLADRALSANEAAKQKWAAKAEEKGAATPKETRAKAGRARSDAVRPTRPSAAADRDHAVGGARRAAGPVPSGFRLPEARTPGPLMLILAAASFIGTAFVAPDAVSWGSRWPSQGVTVGIAAAALLLSGVSWVGGAFTKGRLMGSFVTLAFGLACVTNLCLFVSQILVINGHGDFIATYYTGSGDDRSSHGTWPDLFQFLGLTLALAVATLLAYFGLVHDGGKQTKD